MIIRRLIVPLAVAVTAHAGQALAQDATYGPVSPSQVSLSGECMTEFVPLRKEAEQRGKLVNAASVQHASAVEICKLIDNFGHAEIKMIKYVETNASKCGILQQISNQLNSGHKNTEHMQKKVCAMAQQMPQRGPSGPGDFWPLPEEQL